MSTVYAASPTFFFLFFKTLGTVFYHDDMTALSKWHWDTTATTLISTMQNKGLFLCNCNVLAVLATWIIHGCHVDMILCGGRVFIYFFTNKFLYEILNISQILSVLFTSWFVNCFCFLSTSSHNSFLLIKQHICVRLDL